MGKYIDAARAKFKNETGVCSHDDLEKYSVWLEREYEKERLKGEAF